MWDDLHWLLLAALLGLLVLGLVTIRLRLRSNRRMAERSRAAPEELEVWRPPPRERLLRRQAMLSRIDHERVTPGGDRDARETYRRLLAGDPLKRRLMRAGAWARTPKWEDIRTEAEVSVPLVPAASRAENTADLPAVTVPLEPRARIGHRRQGLESLITEVPQRLRKPPHDPQAS